MESAPPSQSPPLPANNGMWSAAVPVTLRKAIWRLVFGLGQDPVITSIEVAWPSGTKQKFANVAANQFITIDETRGIVK